MIIIPYAKYTIINNFLYHPPGIACFLTFAFPTLGPHLVPLQDYFICSVFEQCFHLFIVFVCLLLETSPTVILSCLKTQQHSYISEVITAQIHLVSLLMHQQIIFPFCNPQNIPDYTIGYTWYMDIIKKWVLLFHFKCLNCIWGYFCIITTLGLSTRMMSEYHFSILSDKYWGT